jgi:hypothetical protein
VFCISVTGDEINIKTSPKALAVSSIDVTSTEGGFNLTFKSRSLSQFSVGSKPESGASETPLDDVISPSMSFHGSLAADGEVEEPASTKEDEMDDHDDFPEPILDDLVVTGVDGDAKQDEDADDDDDDESSEGLVLDDDCSVATVIENTFARSDSLVNWELMDEGQVDVDDDDDEDLASKELPNFLSVSSSFTSSEGQAADQDQPGEVQAASRDHGHEDTIEAMDHFDEQSALARSTMFSPHRELYKVRTGQETTVTGDCLVLIFECLSKKSGNRFHVSG